MQDAAESEQWTQELPPPDGANAEGSSEIIRAWIVHGELGVSMRSEVVSHPAQWGGILADLARWVTVIFKDETDKEGLQKTLDEVVHGFTERILHPEQTHIEVDDQDKE